MTSAIQHYKTVIAELETMLDNARNAPLVELRRILARGRDLCGIDNAEEVAQEIVDEHEHINDLREAVIDETEMRIIEAIQSAIDDCEVRRSDPHEFYEFCDFLASHLPVRLPWSEEVRKYIRKVQSIAEGKEKEE